MSTEDDEDARAFFPHDTYGTSGKNILVLFFLDTVHTVQLSVMQRLWYWVRSYKACIMTVADRWIFFVVISFEVCKALCLAREAFNASVLFDIIVMSLQCSLL